MNIKDKIILPLLGILVACLLYLNYHIQAPNTLLLLQLQHNTTAN